MIIYAEETEVAGDKRRPRRRRRLASARDEKEVYGASRLQRQQRGAVTFRMRARECHGRTRGARRVTHAT